MLSITLILLLVLAGSSLFVAAVLGVLGYSLATFFSPLPLVRGLGEVAWSSTSDFILVAVPMFILMGELLLRSGVTDAMYEAGSLGRAHPRRADAHQHRGLGYVRGHLGLQHCHGGHYRHSLNPQYGPLRL